MKLWYMNDNHTFCELPHNVEDALEIVRRQFDRGFTYGMLCANGGNPFTLDRNAHARGDFAEFEPRATAWLRDQLSYKSPADLEYESWTQPAQENKS